MMLQAGGFSEVHVEKFKLDTAILPIAYQIEGNCIR